MVSVGRVSAGITHNQADRMRTWHGVRVHARGLLSKNASPPLACTYTTATHASSNPAHRQTLSHTHTHTYQQEVMSVPVTWETETVAKIPWQWVLVSELFFSSAPLSHGLTQIDTSPSVAGVHPSHPLITGRPSEPRLSFSYLPLSLSVSLRLSLSLSHHRAISACLSSQVFQYLF